MAQPWRIYRPIYLGDDLFACQPIATAIQNGGGNFILTCKPSSHKTIADYLNGAELEEHRLTVIQAGKRTTTIYRWLTGVPLRDSRCPQRQLVLRRDHDSQGKANLLQQLRHRPADHRRDRGRTRRRRPRPMEDRERDLQRSQVQRYNLEHNFGHGKKTLASILATLNLLAFAFHCATSLAILAAWRVYCTASFM